MSTEAPARTGAEWLDSWDPENEATWDHELAWRTLWVTTFNLTLAFSTWFLVSAIAPRLQGAGFAVDKNQLYWLTAMPGLAGGGLRLLWTFLPPVMGTRRLVAVSSALLLLPLTGWFFALQNPSTSFAVLMMLAFLAGIGGGVFSGFMPSTSYFFPRRLSGTALGLQAGIGNFGVSLVQLLTPWLIGFAMVGSAETFKAAGKPDKQVWLQNAAFVWIPLVLVGIVLAWTMLKSVPVKANLSQQWDIFKLPDTWIMTVLYVMTFGTFSGFAAQFGLLIKNQFGTFEGAPDPLAYAFLGALVGSVARVAFSPLTDRMGGAIWTTIAGLGIAGTTLFTSFFVTPTSKDQFMPFLLGMISIFLFTGIGNASTFKQMPMIFERRQAGGVIGWVSAIAAFGPFIFGVLLSTMAPRSFFYVVVVFALIGTALNWYRYNRPGAAKPC